MTGTVDRRYEDPALPVADRVEILLGQMTVEEKAGTAFHSMISMGPGGELTTGDDDFAIASTDELVINRGINHFNLLSAATSAREIAEWHNRIQDLAASTRLGIPVTVSTDPRHAFDDNPGAALLAGPFSQWPEQLGFGAIRDAELVRQFADIARQEYLAVGLRVALHPQVDLATEPRWARQAGTFGQDAGLTSELVAAYIQGFQGVRLGPHSVATMTKHFPGGGPQLDGEDPHFAYGREQVYPGGRFELHLEPFEAALRAGGSQIMPYYGMPIGTEYEEVGFGFNRSIITGILRERLGFDGIVCTDWGLVSDAQIMGTDFPARAWGVEQLSPAERMAKIMDAGADQFGGESCADLLADLVHSGVIAEDRIDVSVRRILREKFVLGLFDRRHVDPDAAEEIVGSKPFRAAGLGAQRRSLTVLVNGPSAAAARPVLPLAEGSHVYVEGIEAAVVAQYGTPVSTPGEADVAIIRLHAPFEQRSSMFENFFHAGSLDFPTSVIEQVTAVCRQVPTVLSVMLDRPAILTPLHDAAAAIVADYGAVPEAICDVLFGRVRPAGRLPFQLPASMTSVLESRPDVPSDCLDALFEFGDGLDYT